MDKNLYMIMACTLDGGIGYDNSIPWNIPEDLKKFKTLTSKVSDPSKMNAVIMGRNTWNSLPKKPLANRVNVVITRDKTYRLGCKHTVVLHGIPAALTYCLKNSQIENIFVIGGTALFDEFISNPNYIKLINKIYLSVMFYNISYASNKYFDIENLFKNFVFEKDTEYNEQCKKRLFSSYICTPIKYQMRI